MDGPTYRVYPSSSQYHAAHGSLAPDRYLKHRERNIRVLFDLG